MTTGEFIIEATRALEASAIETARLDVLVLLSDCLEQDKASILAHPERTLTAEQLTSLQSQISTRAQHTPLAYIRGKAMFYGRDFIVNPSVLVPRPETEALIELLLNLPLPDNVKIADIGTGSGCIGLTLALELPAARVDLYDISNEALEVAAQNSKRLQAPAHISESSLLTDVVPSHDVIVANLPYVPDHYPVNEAAKKEPSIALYSGPDGLDHYRKFWSQIAILKSKPSYILTESLPSQHHALAQLARNAGYALDDSRGFIQLFSLM